MSTQEIPLKIVGSSTFGRYPKISSEKTVNMFISDNALVNYCGYLKIINNLGAQGRAIFSSSVLKDTICVVDNLVYKLNLNYNSSNNYPYQFNPALIGTLNTFITEVYIAENNNTQVAFTDGSYVYIYDKNSATPFQQITTNFLPGYITFHNNRFIAASILDNDTQAVNEWRLSAINDGTSWPSTSSFVGALETKPDRVVAVTRCASHGNMIFVFGETVTEPWFDVGYRIFSYQRNSSFNIDYGCISPSTVCTIKNLIVWFGQNEKSGPVILASDGGIPDEISSNNSDGIDHLLSTLNAPQDSEAFLFRQDGHLFYSINFYTDNISLLYDFNTKKFYNCTDENGDYFLAKQVCFFQNQHYFISRKNGNVYAINTSYTTYDGSLIPRRRVCQKISIPDQKTFIARKAGVPINQGDTNDQLPPNDITPKVDMRISNDGGESFGNWVSYPLNPIGQRKNKLEFWNLGMSNDLTIEFNFVSFGHISAFDGVVNVRM